MIKKNDLTPGLFVVLTKDSHWAASPFPFGLVEKGAVGMLYELDDDWLQIIFKDKKLKGYRSYVYGVNKHIDCDYLDIVQEYLL